MDLKEIGLGWGWGVDQIYLAWDRGKWLAVMNTVRDFVTNTVQLVTFTV